MDQKRLDRPASRIHGGTIKGFNAVPVQIGGIEDHVHLLIGCKTYQRPSDLIREVKKSSTAWIRGEANCPLFHWQDGYAIFSVSPDACSKVANYIANQKEHHRTKSFREELLDMLERAGVEYDPKFLE